jgi:hypothetical protein
MAKSYSSKFSFSFFVLFTIAIAVALQPGLLAQDSAFSGKNQALGGPSANVMEPATLSVLGPDANPSLPDAPDMGASVNGTAASAAAFAPTPAPVVAVPQPTPELGPHRFWDRENMILFAAVGAMAGADFCVTHANLSSGGRELNPVTRVLSGSTPGLAANFALESGSIIAISYLFHKTGHHRLERLTSVVNVASSASAVSYGLTHR